MRKIGRNRETAQQHMVKRVPKALLHETVKQVMNRLMAAQPVYDTVAYLYIVDEKDVLMGVVSLKDLLNSAPNKEMRQLMAKHLIAVRPFTDGETVALKAIRHRLQAIPVLDGDGRLMGAVPAHVIFDILHWEHTEDLLRMAGFHGQSAEMRHAVKSGVLGISKLRIPSLLIGLVLGILATQVVHFFEASLEEELMLAFFIPVMLYMSAAVGGQTQTILVRTLAVEKVKILPYLLRELLIGAVIGLTIGLLAFLGVLAFFGHSGIALTLGVALFMSITTATLLGILIPALLTRFKKDPAISGGPFLNALQDILSLLIYFAVAGVLL